MDRKAIKAEARAKIKGNLWTIWKPFLVIGLISGVIGAILSGIFGSESTAYKGLSILLELVLMPLTVGAGYYVLKFVRGEKPELNDVFGFYKNFLPIVVVTVIVGALTGLGMILLIVPGIIIALMFGMVIYIMADGETNIGAVLRKSKDMMDGHKWEYFVFGLSFILWILLVAVTFGIAIIYVMPYMEVATAIYYDKLKALKK